MPRRGFFRGGGGDKKNSKKQHKLQQKQQQQQQQQQQQILRQQQHHQQNRLSSSQTSSTNNDSEPPLGLGGSRQTHPTHPEGRSHDLRARGVSFQSSTKSLPQQSSTPAANNTNDTKQTHQNEHQSVCHQYRTQSSATGKATHSSHQHQQHLHLQHHGENVVHCQQYAPQQHGTSPFAHQPCKVHSDSPNQQQVHGKHQVHMPHPETIPPQHGAMAQTIAPTVDDAIEEIWKCETDDFRSASHAVQMLRLAIVAEWESQQLAPETENSVGALPPQFSYDPSDTFLSLQGATLRFHARFESMKADRESCRASRVAASLTEDDQAGDGATVNTHIQSLNGVEWELTEQAAWEVWEESVRASAALTHSCVGPARRRQLMLRRQLIRESEIRLLHQPHLQQFADWASVGSSVGGASMSSSLVSMDISNPQSSGQTVQRQVSTPPPLWQPPADILEMLSFSIPEVLPAAMIRFAASVIETSIPPLRSPETKIYWEPDRIGISSRGVGGGDLVLSSLGRHLHDERRWLRRRKRLGDTQRDLAFGLFCGGNEDEDDATDSENKWSIPGAHTPVAVMIHSWLDTCLAAWPIPRDMEEGKIPYHMEISHEPLVGGNDFDAVREPLPDEIALPSKVDPAIAMAKDVVPEQKYVKFSLWGEIVDLSRVDWWYTLRVLRDCSDLVSAGWRPPPSGRVGEGIIFSLIAIAEKGIAHLAGYGNVRREMPEGQIRKERLVACSCASESLVAIKTLASRDVVPQAALQPLAIQLCQLISETSISSPSSCGSEEVKEDDALFEKEIQTQRTFVASSSAELLWVLLSNEGTACPTTDALLDAIDMNLQVEISDQNHAYAEETAIMASGAIRALSAAMWGDPPSVKGVPLLRFFWEQVVDLLGSVASSMFQGQGDLSYSNKFDIAGRETTVIDVDHQPICNTGPYLNVILEIVFALQRLVDCVMVYGNGDLCATEWESFIRAIDIGISPCLVHGMIGYGSLALEIRNEAMAIISQITSFLARCSQIEYGFHLIVDDDARNYLHLFLLRKVAPLIQTVDSFPKPVENPVMVGDDSTTLALSVIQSWCVIRYLPFKEGDWAKRAGDLLAEAFLVPKSQPSNGHRYIGGYLHHPVVRLEALKSLVNDDSTEIDYSTTRDSDSVSTSGISTITPVSMKSGNLPPAFSLFALTKNLREQHLVLVNSILLPRLEEILSISTPKLGTTECHPSQGLKRVPTAECFDVIEKEFLLRRFAVKMLGMLFRSRTGEGEKRHYFVHLLQNVATFTPYEIREWVYRWEREDPKSSSRAVEPISASDFLRGEEMTLRFEAIRQIEICLAAPFSSLPHTHGNIPTILKSIGDVAIFYSIEYKEEAKYEMGRTDRMLMTLAALLPLARLSCARNGQAILMSRQHVSRKTIPDDILSVVSVGEWLHNISPMVLNETLPIVSEENDSMLDHGDMAPFVFVKQLHARSNEDRELSQFIRQTRQRQFHRSSSSTTNEKQGTMVDFDPVATVFKRVLNAVSRTLSALPKIEKELAFDRTISSTNVDLIPSILCTICYDAISSFLSHGMGCPGMDDLLWMDLDYSTERVDNENELISRSQAVSVFAGVLGHIIVSHIGEEENNLQLGRRVCDVLVRLTMSTCQRVVQHSCCGLISILSSLRHSFERKMAKDKRSQPNNMKLSDPFITDFLISFIDHVCSVLRQEESSFDTVLIPLIDAMRETFICTGSVFKCPISLRHRAFLMLFQPTRKQWELQVVAYQCAVAIINAMSSKEASLMMFFAIGPDRNSKLPNEKRIQPLLIDLLRYRLMSSHLFSTGSTGASYKPSRVHNMLAREALSLETFPIDSDDLGSPKVSAWKCGNVILTLRLGSKDSLYRGWAEIVVRSPCSRVRRLVKWKKELVKQDPLSLLPFWEQLHPKTKEVKEDDAGQNSKDNVPSHCFSEHDPSKQILAIANDTIACFDIIIPPSDNSIDVPSPKQHKDKIERIIGNNKSEKPTRSSSPRMKSNHRKSKSMLGEHSSGQRIPVGWSNLKKTFSDGDLSHKSILTQPEVPTERKRTVYSWLQYATGRELIDTDLIQELNALGLSCSTLGVPESVIIEASYQNLFLHERLKPFVIGPNFNRAISILDRVPPFQTHRVALFYGGPFSTKTSVRNSKADSKANNDGDKFLMATQASTDFWHFAKELGDLVPVRHCKYFSGGLDTSESLSDGAFVFAWFGCQGESFEPDGAILVDSMVVFHTVTLMPDRVTNRKRHVGNDVVHIVYGLDIDTLDVDHERMAISGHFGIITLYVIPLVHVPLYKVSVHLKAGLDVSICSALDHIVGSWLISRRVGAHFVRNLAIQADAICQSMIEDKLGLVLNTEDRNGKINDTERHLA